MTDDYAIEGEEGGYVPCLELPAQLVVEEEGAISGVATGFVARTQQAAALPAPEREAIVGSGVGFVPGPCCTAIMVAGGGGPAILVSSTDGVIWTRRDPAGLDDGATATSAVRDIAWSQDGMFVAVGGLAPTIGAVAYSPDGMTWTAPPVAPDFFSIFMETVEWSPELGLFVASGHQLLFVVADTDFWTSPDGITWTAQPPALAGLALVEDIVWSPALGIFVAIGSATGATILTSPDGMIWTERTLGLSGVAGAVAWSPELGVFVAATGGGSGERAISSDGVTWTEVAAQTDLIIGSGVGTRIRWIASLGLFFMGAFENVVVTSPDGMTWTENPFIPDFEARDFAWSSGLGLLIAVGRGDGTVPGKIATSPDGVAWTERTSGFATTPLLEETALCVFAC